MRKTTKSPGEKIVKDIKRATRKHYSSEEKIRIVLDGIGAWRDNRMIERLWRSLKYECVYLHTFESGSEMREGISKWLSYYNAERPPSTHGILSPDEANASKTEPMILAA
ncbi:MAG: integrase core domain-containing protein [Litoreibacter sp.]